MLFIAAETWVVIVFANVDDYKIYDLAPSERSPQYQNVTLVVFIFMLAMFALMGVVNIDLICQINKREASNATSKFREEKKMLGCVLFIFELGYLWRAFNVSLYYQIEIIDNKFYVITVQDLMYLLEGLSFLTLLCFHKKNFR